MWKNAKTRGTYGRREGQKQRKGIGNRKRQETEKNGKKQGVFSVTLIRESFKDVMSGSHFPCRIRNCREKTAGRNHEEIPKE